MKNVEQLVKTGKCELCTEEVDHMVVVRESDKRYHVHAPFHNQWIVKEMIDQIKQAQKNWFEEHKNDE